MSEENSHELRWRLFRSFFRSRGVFLTLFERYEARVLDLAERFKTHRKRLKIEPDELQDLLDFKRLEQLRDREIFILKETAHELFRGPDATDRFDHFVSNIYHEISILKEEHYTLRDEFVRSDKKEYDRFFREVAEFYPKRLRHVKNLFGKALRRLEELLPGFANEKILVRSIYLFGDELLGKSYPRGLSGLYSKIYPDLGELEGYASVGRSFLESGFEKEALQAFRRAEAAAGRLRRRRRTERFSEVLGEVRAAIAELQEQEPTAADEGGPIFSEQG